MKEKETRRAAHEGPKNDGTTARAKRSMSPEAKAKIAASTKARWAKKKAAQPQAELTTPPAPVNDRRVAGQVGEETTIEQPTGQAPQPAPSIVEPTLESAAVGIPSNPSAIVPFQPMATARITKDGPTTPTSAEDASKVESGQIAEIPQEATASLAPGMNRLKI